MGQQDDENLEFLHSVIAHTKAAAGLPADWGDQYVPLGPEEELEDAPPPALLRTGMTTDELMPYGRTVRTADGADLLVERVVAPPVVTPRGLVWALDPMSFEWQGASLKTQLRGELQPVEVAVLRRETPRGVHVQGAVAVIGDVSKVRRWTALPATRLSVDKGCGAFVAGDRVPDVVAIADAMPWPYVPDGVAPATVDGVVVGAFFDPGDGPWGYEMMLGHGRHVTPEALLVDLHVLPR
ncbi:MAG TPA: hypothetical protein VGD39_05135 [Nocardioides sp.]